MGNAKVVDGSHWTDVVDMTKIKANGVDAFIAKCGQGETEVDPTFLWKANHALEAGMVPGAYYWLSPTGDPLVMANHCASLIKTFGKPMLVAIDIEWNKATDGSEEWSKLTLAQRVVLIRTFLNCLKTMVTGRILLYLPPEFAREALPGVDLSDLDLWTVDYNASHVEPELPPHFTTWAFRQRSGTDLEPGELTPDDLDEFNGPPEGLSAFLCEAV